MPDEVWGDATVVIVGEGEARRAVCTRADTHILVAAELLEQISHRSSLLCTGDMVREGELISFGTDGEGLGRLTYRMVGHDAARIWSKFRLVELDSLNPTNQPGDGNRD